MELNPQVSALLGLVVFVLGQLIKLTKWQPSDNRMRLVVIGMALAFGVGQTIAEATVTPLPAMPTDWAEIVFVWVPEVLQWVGTASVVVAGVAVLAYQTLIKGIGNAIAATRAQSTK